MPEAPAREVAGETGWRLPEVLDELDRLVWAPADGVQRHEADYPVRVAGGLAAPRLEAGKHTGFRWIGAGGLDVLGTAAIPTPSSSPRRPLSGRPARDPRPEVRPVRPRVSRPRTAPRG